MSTVNTEKNLQEITPELIALEKKFKHQWAHHPQGGIRSFSGKCDDPRHRECYGPKCLSCGLWICVIDGVPTEIERCI